jgi:hypothetical protein
MPRTYTFKDECSVGILGKGSITGVEPAFFEKFDAPGYLIVTARVNGKDCNYVFTTEMMAKTLNNFDLKIEPKITRNHVVPIIPDCK